MGRKGDGIGRGAARGRRALRSMRFGAVALLIGACLGGRLPATADTLIDQPIPVDQLPVDSPYGWTVTGLNDAGQVTADSFIPDLSWLRQADGSMVYLNTLDVDVVGSGFNVTQGLNQPGDVVGTVQGPTIVGVAPWLLDHTTGHRILLSTGAVDSAAPVGIATTAPSSARPSTTRSVAAEP